MSIHTGMKKILLPLFLSVALSGLAQDIVVTDVTGSHSSPRYGVMDNQIILKNTGIVDVNKFISVVIVLSIDNLYDTNDPVIGLASTSSLTSGSTQTVAPAFLTSNLNKLAAGNYYMIIVADPSSNISETDKTNNTFLLPYSITPSDVDFTLTDFTTDKTTYPANDLIIPAYTLKNVGATPLAQQGFWTDFYLVPMQHWM